jgi:hypothetical protein
MTEWSYGAILLVCLFPVFVIAFTLFIAKTTSGVKGSSQPTRTDWSIVRPISKLRVKVLTSRDLTSFGASKVIGKVQDYDVSNYRDLDNVVVLVRESFGNYKVLKDRAYGFKSAILDSWNVDMINKSGKEDG